MDLCEQWPLVVADFGSEYGIRLASASLSWREFVHYLTGLLACDSRLYRHFTFDDESADGGGANGSW